MKIRNIFTICLLSIFLVSCQGAKDAFQSKKRSNTNEEFLIKKKLPLTTPPDMNKLPLPEDSEDSDEQIEINEETDLKKILDISNNETESQDSNENTTSLEQSILKKINN